MSRPKRKKIKFTEESLEGLFQEIYDENHNIKAEISRLFTKWEVRIKEDGNIAAIGDQVIKLIGARAKNQDQKIMVLKYLKEVVFNDKTGIGGGTATPKKEGELTTDRRNEILTSVANKFDVKLDELEDLGEND